MSIGGLSHMLIFIKRHVRNIKRTLNDIYIQEIIRTIEYTSIRNIFSKKHRIEII